MKTATGFLKEYLVSEGKKVSDAYTMYVWMASNLGHQSVSRNRFIKEVESGCGLKVVDDVFQKVSE